MALNRPRHISFVQGEIREYHIHQWGTVGLSIPVPGFRNETVLLNKTTGTLTYIDRGFNEGLLYL
jgi:hypothetical protein